MIKAAALAVLCVLALWAKSAAAHEWYPAACCSSTDCFPLEWSEIDVVPGGYVIKETGEFIASDAARITPAEGAGLFHRCSYGGDRAGSTIGMQRPKPCFWAPVVGM